MKYRDPKLTAKLQALREQGLRQIFEERATDVLRSAGRDDYYILDMSSANELSSTIRKSFDWREIHISEMISGLEGTVLWKLETSYLERRLRFLANSIKEEIIDRMWTDIVRSCTGERVVFLMEIDGRALAISTDIDNITYPISPVVRRCGGFSISDQKFTKLFCIDYDSHDTGMVNGPYFDVSISGDTWADVVLDILKSCA